MSKSDIQFGGAPSGFREANFKKGYPQRKADTPTGERKVGRSVSCWLRLRSEDAWLPQIRGLDVASARVRPRLGGLAQVPRGSFTWIPQNEGRCLNRSEKETLLGVGLDFFQADHPLAPRRLCFGLFFFLFGGGGADGSLELGWWNRWNPCIWLSWPARPKSLTHM